MNGTSWRTASLIVRVMKQSDPNPSRRRSLALFVAGLPWPVVVLVGSGLAMKYDWTRSSRFLDFAAIPLLVLGVALCVGAPFLLRIALSKRVLLAFAALMAYVAVAAVTAVICIARFGLPIN